MGCCLRRQQVRGIQHSGSALEWQDLELARMRGSELCKEFRASVIDQPGTPGRRNPAAAPPVAGRRPVPCPGTGTDTTLVPGRSARSLPIIFADQVGRLGGLNPRRLSIRCPLVEGLALGMSSERTKLIAQLASRGHHRVNGRLHRQLTRHPLARDRRPRGRWTRTEMD